MYELLRQESAISDLWWAASKLKKEQQMPVADQKLNVLKQIEWTVFDLKNSTMALMEDICLRESECSDWSDWSACSVSCGSGTSLRTRECTVAGKLKSSCNPKRSESTTCSEDACETVIPHFYIAKLGYAGVYLFFLFLLQNIDCGYSLEPPHRGGSNVYPQSMF